jgi:hypothetical protein
MAVLPDIDANQPERTFMKKIAVLASAAVGVCAVALLLAATWDGESSATAKANFCSSLRDLSSTVVSYEGMSPATTTNDERDAAAADISDAWDNVVNDANDWAYADDNSLTQAYDDLYYAIEDLPGDYTITQSLDALQPELSAFPGAYHETFDGSGCGSS